MEEEQNINSEIDIQNESEIKEENIIKKIDPPNKNTSNNSNLKSLSKTKPILKNLNTNSDVNQFFIAPIRDLSYFNQFPGFFNKNFNLTSFKKEREESRSLSKSPIKIRLPHQIRGNGIPKQFKERYIFLKEYFEN